MTGSRIGGQSALAKSDYIEREGKYAKDAEDLAYRESGNMPGWAEDDPRQYWAAADEHERANGRLFVQVEFALPRELDDRQQREVASSFAADLTGGERLPYTLAIHRGGVNPHAHLMISERGLDGHDRDAATWFKRANTKDPEKGGAKKTSTLSSREWLEDTRERWADRANEALERAGFTERISEATLKEQYFEAVEVGNEHEAARLQGREPGVHIGPHNIHRRVLARGAKRPARGGDGRPGSQPHPGGRGGVDSEWSSKSASLRRFMTELEQRLINDLSRLAEQYEREQKQQFEQVKSLSEHVRGLEQRVSGLAEQYEQEQKQQSEQVKIFVRARSGVYQRTQGGTDTVSDVGQQLSRAATSLRRTRERFDGCLQQSRGSFGRAIAMIRFEIEHKRKERKVAATLRADLRAFTAAERAFAAMISRSSGGSKRDESISVNQCRNRNIVLRSLVPPISETLDANTKAGLSHNGWRRSYFLQSPRLSQRHPSPPKS